MENRHFKNGRYWLPIPSLGNRYEINGKGDVRNAATHKVLRKCVRTYENGRTGEYVNVRHNGGYTTRSIPMLMYEVHGSERPYKNAPVEITAIDPSGKKHVFASQCACAFALAAEVGYCECVLKLKLAARMPEIGAWHFKYKE